MEIAAIFLPFSFIGGGKGYSWRQLPFQEKGTTWLMYTTIIKKFYSIKRGRGNESIIHDIHDKTGFLSSNQVKEWAKAYRA